MKNRHPTTLSKQVYLKHFKLDLLIERKKSKILNQSIYPVIDDVIYQYCGLLKSAKEVQESLKLGISTRQLQRSLSTIGVVRNYKESLIVKKNTGKQIGAKKKEHIYIGTRKTIGASLRWKILSRDMYRCVICGATAETTTLEIDHIISPLKGGENNEKNLRTLCYKCNIGRGLAEQRGLYKLNSRV